MAEVEARSVRKCFGSVTAVDGVSFQVEEGEFFSLLGPSGCGKTTLLRMLAGLEFPDEGAILIGGNDITYTSAYARPTNLVFQNLALFPHMTVFHNVAFGLRMRKVPAQEIRRRVEETLQLVRLEGMENRRPNQLSGGQQQRVAIARALINEPRVLLFDEPLGALDLKLRLQLQVELKALQKKSGTTFIYVTHDQGEALTMSDRIAVMKGGSICQIGSPIEIYSRPATSFVANFIGDTNLFEATIKNTGDSEEFIVLGIDRTIMKACKAAGSIGETVWVSVRQESLRIGPNAEGAENLFTARILDTSFSGSAIKYRLALGDLTLTANVPSIYVTKIYTRDEEVVVGWRACDMIVLPH